MAARVRFLHCGGFQFDSPAWEGPEEWASLRNQDLWQTFEAVLALCRSEKIDLLFLTGDLFEQEYVRKETVDRVVRTLAKLDETRIFITPGERDPLVNTSAYRLALWPNKVHIFSKGINSVKIPTLNVTVYGAGWTAYRQDGPFLDGFQTKEDGTLQLMLLHAVVDPIENLNKFIPIIPEQIAASGLDYLALGHKEEWSGIQQAGETFWADCGSPEARSFRESGPHGVLLGEIGEERGSTKFEFRELGQRRYVEKALLVQADMEGLAAKLLAETSISEQQRDLFRIKVSGAIREGDEAAVQSLQKLLADKFRYLEIISSDGRLSESGSKVVTTVEGRTENGDGNGLPTLKQVFSANMQERLVAESAEKLKHWELVQKIGLAALGQGREDDEEKGCHRMLDFLLELFYDFKTPSTLKADNRQGIMEVWVSEDSFRYHIRRQFIQQGDEREGSSTLVIEDETGKTVSLPDSMMLGEYLFGVKIESFLQGGVVEWPERNEEDNFYQRVRNLRQGGDERFSLTKVRASIAGAQKRVNDQRESMVLVKAEYDALRHDWESAHRQQEEKRVCLIEIKNLQEREKILAESLAAAAKLQERLAVLTQNPDYRELRQLQGELARLEDSYLKSELNLRTLTCESRVDWAMIESLREECKEWAFVQDQVGRLAAITKIRAQEIKETDILLHTSGYQGLEEDADQRLRRVEEDRDAAQEELDKLILTKHEIEEIQSKVKNERARLHELEVMTEVTDAVKTKIADRERHLTQWQNSKVGSLLDRACQEQFGGKSIGERLSFRLAQDYQNYQVSNYKEFQSKLQEFHERRQRVERLHAELERLQANVNREEKLHKIVNSHTKILNQAYAATKTANLSAWLNGWQDYIRKIHRLQQSREALQLEIVKQQMEEDKMAACAEQLQLKLENWGTPATNREEVLAEVLKVAKQLRIKEETEKEVAVLAKRYRDLLGDRNIEQLAEILEPLAELERESCLSKEERQADLADINKERLEVRRQLKTAEHRLQGSQKYLSLSALEKKIENVKQKWMAYEDLLHALLDVQALLEVSWREWQTKYGKELEREAEWIVNKISSSSTQGTYFSYRMAVAQLALHYTTEAPLFLYVEETKEEQNLWEDILGYLHNLSVSRKVVLVTSDEKLWRRILASDCRLAEKPPQNK